MPKPSSPPMPGSCQSCTFLGMQRNGSLDPGFRIPGAPRFLRGWSVSVDGCPLAERRATTHPPGSLTPKERASTLREQCSLQGSREGEAPSLAPLRKARRPYSAAARFHAPRRSAYALRGRDTVAALWAQRRVSHNSQAFFSSTIPLLESQSVQLLPAPSLRLASGKCNWGLAQRSSQPGVREPGDLEFREVAANPGLSELLGSGILAY